MWCWHQEQPSPGHCQPAGCKDRGLLRGPEDPEVFAAALLGVEPVFVSEHQRWGWLSVGQLPLLGGMEENSRTRPGTPAVVSSSGDRRGPGAGRLWDTVPSLAV